MPNRKNHRGKRTRRANNPLVSSVKAITHAVKDLTVLTQDRGLPDRPDRQPMPMPRRNPVYTFTRSCSKGTITATNGETLTALSFTLNDVPLPSDFTSLFDQYRIIQVILEFIPVTQPFGPSTTATDLPSVHTVIDYDDDTTPTSINTLRQYSTHQIVSNQSYFKRVLTPRFTIAAYSGAFTSYSLGPVNTWQDANSPGIIYYGVKVGTSPVTTVSGSFILYNVEATYTIQCSSSH